MEVVETEAIGVEAVDKTATSTSLIYTKQDFLPWLWLKPNVNHEKPWGKWGLQFHKFFQDSTKFVKISKPTHVNDARYFCCFFNK